MDEQIAGLVAEMKSTFEAFKTAADKEQKERESAGEATAETKQEVSRISERMSALEVKLNRPGATSTEDEAGVVSAEHKAAFGTWARKGAVGPDQAKALVQNANGEILVTEEVEAGLQTELRRANEMRALVEVRTVGKNRLSTRRLTGIVTGWGKLETGDETDEDNLTAAADEIRVHNQVGLALIGVDELADADYNLEQFLSEEYGFEFAEDEEAAMINGSGVGEPTGMLDGATVDRVPAGQAGEVTADDVLDLIYAVPKQYRRNGQIAIPSSTELVLRKAKDGQGQYLWAPASAGTPATFAGFGIVNAEDIPAIHATNAADVAIFGDFRRGYKLVDRRGTTIQRLVEKYSTEGKVGFLATRRVGGGVTRANALRVLQVPAAA